MTWSMSLLSVFSARQISSLRRVTAMARLGTAEQNFSTYLNADLNMNRYKMTKTDKLLIVLYHMRVINT